MDASFPQDLFSNYGMTSIFFIVASIELLSIIYLLAIIAEFRMVRHRHEVFIREIGGDGMVKLDRVPSILFSFYVIATLLITAITMILFFFQPHLL